MISWIYSNSQQGFQITASLPDIKISDWLALAAFFLTFLGGIIAAIAIVIAVVQQRLYSKEIRKGDEALANSEALRKRLDAFHDLQANQMREALLAVDILGQLVISGNLERKYRSARMNPTTQKALLSRIEAFMRARTSEFRWLISSDPEWSGHLDTLGREAGDRATLDLVERILELPSRDRYRQELLTARTRIETRIETHII